MREVPRTTKESFTFFFRLGHVLLATSRSGNFSLHFPSRLIHLFANFFLFRSKNFAKIEGLFQKPDNYFSWKNFFWNNNERPFWRLLDRFEVPAEETPSRREISINRTHARFPRSSRMFRWHLALLSPRFPPGSLPRGEIDFTQSSEHAVNSVFMENEFPARRIQAERYEQWSVC